MKRGPKAGHGLTSLRVLRLVRRTDRAETYQLACDLDLSPSTIRYHLRQLRAQGMVDVLRNASKYSQGEADTWVYLSGLT